MAWGAQLEDKQPDAEESERLTPLSVLVGLAMAAVAAAGARVYDSAARNREARLARQAWERRRAQENTATDGTSPAETVKRARAALAKLREDQTPSTNRSRRAPSDRSAARER